MIRLIGGSWQTPAHHAAPVIPFARLAQPRLGHRLVAARPKPNRLGGLEADGLADEDDVDAAREFLVDFQDLAARFEPANSPSAPATGVEPV